MWLLAGRSFLGTLKCLKFRLLLGLSCLFEIPVDSTTVPRVYEVTQRFGIDLHIFTGSSEFKYTGNGVPDKVLSLYVPEVTPERADEVVDELSKLSEIAVHKMSAWDEKFMAIDVVNPSASKLHGIVELQRLLNITKEEIIGVGDGYNDFPLLMASGLKIAMRNAVDELKEIADFIAPSVDDDGVAVVIEKIILAQ